MSWVETVQNTFKRITVGEYEKNLFKITIFYLKLCPLFLWIIESCNHLLEVWTLQKICPRILIVNYDTLFDFWPFGKYFVLPFFRLSRSKVVIFLLLTFFDLFNLKNDQTFFFQNSRTSKSLYWLSKMDQSPHFNHFA